ncbi:MAG: hypothetical protein AMXMBFR33_38330 [Candidatus Xenobia bacterium]
MYISSQPFSSCFAFSLPTLPTVPVNWMGPPCWGWNLGGLSSTALAFPGTSYNGGHLGQALGGTLGYGGWGCPELSWSFLMSQVTAQPGSQLGPGYNPLWAQFEGQLSNGNCHCNCPEEASWEEQLRRELARLEAEAQAGCTECQQPPAETECFEPECELEDECVSEPDCQAPPAETEECVCESECEPEGECVSEPDCQEPPAETDECVSEPDDQEPPVETDECVSEPDDQEPPAETGECVSEPDGEEQPSEPDPEPLPECQEWQPEPGQDLAWASQTVVDHFDLLDTASGQARDGLVSRQDLESLLRDNPDAPPELRDACELLLRNDSYFHSADAARGGTPDGLISRDDAQRNAERFQLIEERPPGESFSPTATAEVLERYAPLLDTANGGQADGVFGREDLQQVLEDPNAPAELKRAARQALENSYLFNSFDDAKHDDGNLDGKISIDDLRAAQERFQGLTPEPVGEGPMTEARAARTLERYLPMIDQAAGQGGRDDKLGRADLEALAASPDLPPDLRQAVDLLLANEAVFHHFDQAADSNGDLDGEIGLAGLQALGGQC